MATNVNDYAKMGDLGLLATKVKGKLDLTPKSVFVVGNTVQFFASTDHTGDPLFTFDFAEEIFLDQTVTSLVENFTWSAATYPGSTNPNLDGKTVLVLGVKGDKETNPTVKYSFVSLENLIKDLMPKITNPTEGNIPQIQSDGTLGNSTVPLANVLQKVANPTQGHVAIINSDGTIADSGYGVASDEDVAAYLDSILG